LYQWRKAIYSSGAGNIALGSPLNDTVGISFVLCSLSKSFGEKFNVK